MDMKTISDFSKQRGFVYQGSEIYGGLANSWDYGPYGAQLKDNIRALWLREFVQKRTDMVQLDAGILMNPQVWVASGHVATFADPLVDCKQCKTRHRADKLVEDKKVNAKNPDELDVVTFMKKEMGAAFDPAKMNDGLAAFLAANLNCPNCGKRDWTAIRSFNLMFKTFQGVTEDSTATVYLRPETAQGIFVNFGNVARTSRKKVPFGIAQVGKAFRNEITPGNFIFRTREFEQLEIEFFCEPESVKPGEHLVWHGKWKDACMKYLTDTLKLDSARLRMRDHSKEELSHYSSATSDIEFLFPQGWGELWGIADRTDFDLKAHMKESKQDLSYLDPYTNQKYVPYVIEPSLGLNRTFLAVLTNAYTEVPAGEEGGTRVVMKFAPSLAPVKVAILPIVKKFSDLGRELYAELSQHFACEFDEAGNLGKRYYRYDEVGVPFSIAIDPEHWEAGEVTVRHRDTGLQDVVKRAELVEWIRQRVA